MKNWKLWITLGCMIGVCASCSNESKKADDTCNSEHLCPDDQVCANSKCIDRCRADSCGKGEACSHTGLCLPASLVECSEFVQCADTTKQCVEGHCVEPQNTPECSEQILCKDTTKQCVEGHCVEPQNVPECSDSNSCKGNKKCVGGKCIDNQEENNCSSQNKCPDGSTCISGSCKPLAEIVCYSDRECGEGYICDNTVCILEGTCSPTRKCKDSRVCHEGTCIDKPLPSCSKAIACPDPSQTCIAGKCIVCHCDETESCQPDGSCLPKSHSDVKNADVGDRCTWSADYSACDGNRVVSCSQVSGQEDHTTVKINDCGPNICADASDDGINCYEPCTNAGDFYGECLQDYNSESGTTQGIAFNTVCEKTADNKLIWTYVGAPEYCKYRCVDGNCVFIPEEYGDSCTPGTTEDKCIGDWYLFCEKPTGYPNGVIYAENCVDYYQTPHQCVIDKNGEGSCVTACTIEDANKTINICNYYMNSSWYSDSITCRQGDDDLYYWFSNGYKSCTSGCDQTTGLCK